MKRVLTFGVFDLLHLGHILLFKHAREKGDYLIAAVQEDDFVLKFKPEAKIVNSTEEREMMVAAIRYVDEVITYKDVSKDIKNIDFEILAKGPDQKHEGFQSAMKWCRENQKEIVEIPRTDGISSTLLREFLQIK